jgi:flagellar biosynthetic protein FliR
MTGIPISEFLTGFLIFMRVLGLMFFAPVYMHANFNMLARLFFALVITYILFWNVPESYVFTEESNLILLGIMGMKEFIIGMLMGFFLNFVFYGISLGGHIIGFELGIAIALAFDPTTESQSNVISQMLQMGAIIIFLLINGHHYVIRALSYSFELIDMGNLIMSDALITMLIKYTAGMFIIAIKISAPLLVSFMLLHVAAGIIARMIPQMQVFFVLLPLKTGLGLALLIASLPLIVYVISNMLGELEEGLYDLLKAIGNA